MLLATVSSPLLVPAWSTRSTSIAAAACPAQRVWSRSARWGRHAADSSRRRGRPTRGAAAEEPPAAGAESFKFPFMSGPSQRLLTEMAETLDREIGPHLRDSQTPDNVRYFKSAAGNAEGSVVIRSGKDSKVDFMLQSWIHAALPFGTLDIGTTVVMMGTETDSPHFLFEFIRSGPTLVVVLDHLPRRDLVADAAYLKRFYEDTELEKLRRIFDSAQGCKPYVAQILFIRTVVSPTAAFFQLTDSDAKGGGLDQQIASVVHPGATQMLRAWLESFETRGLPVQDPEGMAKRDNEIKVRGVEVDLSANLPRLYGPEIAARVVEAFRAGR